MALTRRPPIGELGLPGPGQLEEWEEVAGVPVPVQVGVQARLLAPRGVPRAVLEAQLIVDLEGARRGRRRREGGAMPASQRAGGSPGSPHVPPPTYLEGQRGRALLEAMLEDDGGQHAARAVVRLDVLLKVPFRGKALSCGEGKGGRAGGERGNATRDDAQPSPKPPFGSKTRGMRPARAGHGTGDL